MSGDSAAQAALLAKLTVAQLHRSIVSYFNAVAAVTFIYDYILTFDTEVEQIWKAPWTPLKVAYLLQRYLPFFDTVYLSIVHGSAPNLSPQYCRRNYDATIIMDMLSMIGISEGILTFRTWAVWRRDRKVGIIMGSVYLLFFASSCVLGILFLRGMKFGIFPIPGFDGCFITGGNAFMSICWVLLFLYDGWMVGWMAVQATRTFRQGGQNALMRTVYRDGIVYYVFLLMFSLVNAVIATAIPHDLSFVLTPLERVMVSILTSRVVLSIRSSGNSKNVHVHQNSSTNRSNDLTSISLSTRSMPVPPSVATYSHQTLSEAQSRPVPDPYITRQPYHPGDNKSPGHPYSYAQ